MIPKTQKLILIILVTIILAAGIAAAGLFFFSRRSGEAEKTEVQTSTEINPETDTAAQTAAVQTAQLPQTPEYDPLSLHGRLHVSGGKLVDKDNNLVQLRGVSSHHLTLYPEFFNAESLKYIRDEWGVNVIRLANYTEFFGDGYCDGGDSGAIDQMIQNTVQIADELGMYVILDWHTLTDNNPMLHSAQAIRFFSRYASLYKDHDNILYEICNEPSGDTTWNDIRRYADLIIPLIRKQDPDSVILVAPAQYTTDYASVIERPLSYRNIMYTLHFYAGTHKEELRSVLQDALTQQLPVFISECNITDTDWSGGKADPEQGKLWFDLVDTNMLSYTVWSFTDKDEVFSFFRPDTGKMSGFDENDLTEVGLWHADHFLKLKSPR